MKYKVLSLVLILASLLAAVFFTNVSFSKTRTHQHLESRPYQGPVVTRAEAARQIKKENFSTHLPLLEVKTDGPIPPHHVLNEAGRRVRNRDEVLGNLRFFTSQEKDVGLTDSPTLEERISFRVRGRSSRNYDKKSYLLKFKEAGGLAKKDVSLLGMVADTNYALHGPFMDKTLIRNYLSYNLAGEIMDYSPQVRFCELFLNGVYQGVYLLMEKVEYHDEGRLNLTQTDPDLTSTSYILQLDVGADDDFYQLKTFLDYTNKKGPSDRGSQHLEISYPEDSLTPAQKDFIEKEISTFEKALTSYDSADPDLGYPAFLDVGSFVDYFIINEFTMNADAGRLSTYLYKDLRGKMKAAVWDFNSAFNNYEPDMASPHSLMMTDKFWYAYLLRDGGFSDRLVRRYQALRQGLLSDDYLLNYIDETVAYLGPAILRNEARWGYAYEPKHDLVLPTQRNPRSYEAALDQLKTMVQERGAFMDENLETIRFLSHKSVNKQFRQEGQEGTR